MLEIAIVILCLAVAVACLGLAYLLFRHQQGKVRAAAPPLPAIEPATPAREIVHDDARAEWSAHEWSAHEAQAAPMAEYWAREQLRAAAREQARPAVPEPATAIVPRDVMLARHQAVPRADPAHPPARPPTPERSADFATRLANDELKSQLDIATRAFARWQSMRDTVDLERLAKGPEQPLNQVLRDIAGASDEVCAALLEPALQRNEAGLHRVQVAAFALLRRDEHHALRLIEQRLGDPALTLALRELLSLWRGPQTNKFICEQARRAGEHRNLWLDLLLERRADPGPELLRELVGSEAPELLMYGLALAKFHADPELRQRTARAHLSDTQHPARYMAAVELALFDREASAWPSCLELANASQHPRAAELVASFGSARELEALMRGLAATQGEDLWRLCRSGRKVAAALAATRLRDTYGDALAARGLKYVIGPPANGVKSVEALLRRWTKLAPTLFDDHRYLYGERFGSTNSLRACLSSHDELHHQALGDELFFRSKGKIRWAGRGFAQDILTGIKAVGTPNINFEQSFD